MPKAHWIPFAAPRSIDVTPCDVDAYFATNQLSSTEATCTFRGRSLVGLKVDLGTDFSCVIEEESTDPVALEELWIWNHDDKPLRSDVVPQAVNLARIEHALGSYSGIQ